ncbi:hypothetical protein G9F71_008205 [Clostridium sp. FP2]|uniref:hypothetical protein n=1 Tax=Clostridium sp. FP2 TaxID=2724481 RepID=UPI0013E900AB|nr:hypothetical protein [Clostridium sp. FP2]MBZ9622833.1 hypothetical protein [Clostridium sp. FP2]
MEVSMIVVEIIANRIMDKGENPKTHQIFLLSDIINAEYKKAIEDWIILHSKVII